MKMRKTTSMKKKEVSTIEKTKDSYNELVYHSKSFGVTSVNSLEAKARIWGLDPVPVAEARVLELGCSMGGNIIGQAVHHPKGTYVGVDLSASQIDIGNQLIQSMELQNITLLERDIMSIDASFGTFDYIIVHGIWSWVPDMVKDKILEICDVNLSERGVAYVSYNVYPGWHRLSQVREMMKYAIRDDQDMGLLEQTEKGIAFVEQINSLLKKSEEVVPKLKWKTDSFDSALAHKSYYIAHEYLEPINDPVYIHEFIERAETHHLAYVADTDFQLSAISWIQSEKRAMIDALSGGDWNTKEQILDYYYDTQFRRSMLCHASQAHKLRHQEEFLMSTLDELYFIYTRRVEDLKDTEYKIEQGLVNVCKKGGFFTVADYEREIKTLLENEEFPKVDMYSMLIRFLLCGLVAVFTETKDVQPFQEGISRVPKESAKYVETVVNRNGNEFINVSDRFNDSIEGLHAGHVVIMNALSEPKTLDELYTLADDVLTVNETKEDGQVVPLQGRSVVDGILADLSRLGFLQHN